MLKLYALRPYHTVIGTIRGDVDFGDIETGDGSKIITVQMDVREVDSPEAALFKVKADYGITKIDIVRFFVEKY